MPRRDARELDHKTLEEIRIRAVEQVQTGESPEAVIKALGFSRSCIYTWLALYRAGGWGALKAQVLKGRPMKISAAQMKWLYQTITGKNPLLDIALKLEEIALSDEYFTSRKLYPNVDFYSGLIYQAMGFPLEMFPVLFAIPRTAGWLAHWQEMLNQDSKIARPRQLYIGEDERNYVPIAERS